MIPWHVQIEFEDREPIRLPNVYLDSMINNLRLLDAEKLTVLEFRMTSWPTFAPDALQLRGEIVEWRKPQADPLPTGEATLRIMPGEMGQFVWNATRYLDAG